MWTVGEDGETQTIPLGSKDLRNRSVIVRLGDEDWVGSNDGIVVLQWDALEGAWSAASRMLGSVPHALVWDREEHLRVREFVKRSRSAGTMKPRQINSDGIYFIEDVRFDSEAGIVEALKASGLTGINLAGSTSPRLSLRDGLKVSNRLHSAIYIHGGEPDLAIPPGPDSGLEIVLNKQDSTKFPMGVLVPLRALSGQIMPGHHILESSYGRVQFETISPGDTLPAENDNDNSAAALIEDAERADTDKFGERLAVVRRRGDKTWLVGPDAQIREIEEPPAPPYWHRVLPEVPAFHFFVRRHSFERWLIQRRGSTFVVEELLPIPTDNETECDPSIDEELWCHLLRAASDACESVAWQALLKIAGIEQ